jgi:flagellar motor switch/type III secretory pathway protein FliN
VTVAWAPPSLWRSHRPCDLWNALVSHCGSPIPLAHKGVTAVFETTASPKTAKAAVLLEAGPLRAVVLFDAFPFATLFGADIEADDLDQLPIALRNILIEGMVSIFWSLIPQNRLPRYVLLAISNWRDSPAVAGEALDWIAISIEGLAPQPARLRIGCAALEVVSAIVEGELAARAAWASLRSKLTTEAFFTLGRVPAPLAGVRSLDAGDVLVLAAIDENLCSIRLQRGLYAFRRAAKGWVCISSSSLRRRNRKAATVPDISAPVEVVLEEQAALASAPQLSSLMLDVDLDFGSVRVPLATVETWQVGAVVELEPPSLANEPEITIRINDQEVAKGDLVRINDRLAVRVTRLLMQG